MLSGIAVMATYLLSFAAFGFCIGVGSWTAKRVTTSWEQKKLLALLEEPDDSH